MANESTADGPLFKRRKVTHLRRRASSLDRNAEPPASEPDSAGDAPTTDIIRRAKAPKQRAGIQFTSSELRPPTAIPDSAETAVEKQQTAIDAARSRFTVQTGIVEDTTDKHLDAFIDAKLNRPSAIGATESVSANPTPDPSPYVTPQRQIAQGKLQEVQLDDAAARNRALTEAARQRLASAGTAGAAPPRADTPGRPLKRKQRNRRGSVDLARDSLVDAVLGESQLHYYDAAKVEGDEAEEEDADTRLARQFEQEFMEHVEQRNAAMNARMRTQAQAAKDRGGTQSRGPKLGGSRSQRAAMVAMEKAKRANGDKGAKGATVAKRSTSSAR